ncbi:MAG: 2,3-butanediol dehydrogenase [Clostridiales Family XIII bacterium]|nr:2,3-butanediol dehydrogenase [Clostridia bacterium]MDY3010686.1 2,3-butanediol dehydrogenase [Clostridiales Family XIII bacterium]
MKTMKAGFFYGKRDIRIEETQVPAPDAGEVIVEVKRCGICGTDLHEYKDGAGSHVTFTSPNPVTGDQVPIIMGHEFSGVIVQVAEGVTNWKVGDRVAIMPLLSCGKCYHCLRGNQHMCEHYACTGLQWHWGGFAQYCKAKEYQLNKIPDNVTYEQAACIEPTALGMYAVERSHLKAGDTVFISGGGPTAVLSLLCAKAAGATKVYMSEPMPKRRQRLIDFGATEAFDPTKVDVIKEVKERTNGRGTDIVIDCSGVEMAINQGFEIVKKRGMYVQSGLSTRPFTIQNPSVWADKDLDIAGLWCYKITSFQSILDLMGTGQLPAIERIVTKVIQLEDLKAGFETLADDEEGTEVKIQVSFE